MAALTDVTVAGRSRIATICQWTGRRGKKQATDRYPVGSSSFISIDRWVGSEWGDTRWRAIKDVGSSCSIATLERRWHGRPRRGSLVSTAISAYSWRLIDGDYRLWPPPSIIAISVCLISFPDFHHFQRTVAPSRHGRWEEILHSPWFIIPPLLPPPPLRFNFLSVH